MARTNPRAFMTRNFPELWVYKRTTSRMFESKEKHHYYDDWWFKLGVDDLDKNEFIIFIGAKDYIDKDFKVFKVPSAFLAKNLESLSKTDAGWINIYVHFETMKDLRHPDGLSFAEFALN